MPVEELPLPVLIYSSLLFIFGIAAAIHYLFIAKTPKLLIPKQTPASSEIATTTETGRSSGGKVIGWRINPADFFTGLFAVLLTILLLQIGLAKAFDVSDEPGPNQMILLGAAAHLAALALLFIFHKTHREKFKEPFESVKLSWPKAAIAGIYSFLIMVPVIYLISFLWQFTLQLAGHQPVPQDTVILFSEIDTVSTTLIMVLLTVFIAPISEEFIFRGCIYRFLKDKTGILGALALSGILFAMLHHSLSTVFPLFALGVALAYSYEKTGSLKVPILFHAFFNVNTVLLILLTKPA